MAIVTYAPAQSEATSYTHMARFTRWNGFFLKNPVLRAVISAIADAETTSWTTKGKNARSAKKLLKGIYGNGKQTFKTINNSGSKMGMIGGEEYYLKIRVGGEVVNLRILDPANVTQIIENGKITAYRDNTNNKDFLPDDIVHIPNNPSDSSPHGYSDIEPLENILINQLQIWDDSARIFHRYIKPMHIVYLATDYAPKVSQFTTLWNATRETPEQDLIVPKDIVDKIEKVSIPQGSNLDPMTQEKTLMMRMLQSFRFPEIALGAGTANSEEAVRMLNNGLRQLIRWRQQYREEMWQCQLFKEIYGDESPTLEFSFAAEPEEEKFNRFMQLFTTAVNTNLTDEVKAPIIRKALEGMNLL